MLHYGTLIIVRKAKIGTNARTHCFVNIGGTDDGVPIIGNNVYIGPIVLGENIKIGTNAVVNKFYTDRDCTLVGIPAKSK